jgi:uncharacterized protein (TIGR03067 family)
MKKFLPPLCVFLAVLLLGADDKPKADDAKAKLQGTWVIVNLEDAGEKVPENNYKDSTLTFEGDKVTSKIKDRTELATYKIDAGQKPPHLDVTPAKGERNGKTLKLIYQLDGDTLKFASTKDGAERPQGFDDKGLSIFTLKREKK